MGHRHPARTARRRALHILRDPATSRAVVGGADGGGGLTLYIADADAGEVLEATLRLVDGGWPEARLVRRLLGPVPSPSASPRAAPWAIAAAEGLLWIADAADHSLSVIDLHSGALGHAAGSGRPGHGAGVDPGRPLEAHLPRPCALACVQGQVLIAMAAPARIWVYLTELDRVGALIGSGAVGQTDGAFATATFGTLGGMVMAGQRLLVADGDRIRVADLATRQLATLTIAAAPDDAHGEPTALSQARDVATAEHVVYVADAGHGAVMQINVDDGSLRRLTAPGALREPDSLEALGDYLLVADMKQLDLQAVRLQDGEVRPLIWSV